MNFRPATCPNCGGSLQLHDYRASADCAYCGTSIQSAAAGNITNWLKLADTAAAAGNFQEALDYYTRVLEVDAGHAPSWYGKGLAVGSLSTPSRFRVHEMLACFRAALEHAADGGPRDEMRRRVATAAAGLCDRAYRSSYQQVCACAADPAAWGAHLEQSRAVINALEFAHHSDPEARAVVAMIVEMSRHLREGVAFQVPGQSDHRGRPVVRRHDVAGEYLAWLQRLEAVYGPKLGAMSPAPAAAAPPPSVQYRTTPVRSVGPLLGLGVFFLPYVFSWLTLRAGHTTRARALAFGWMGLILLGNLLGRAVSPEPQKPAALLAPAQTAAAAVPPPPPAPPPALSSAEKLSRAKQLSGGVGAAAEQLNEAMRLLGTIPASDREAKEAKALEARLRERLARAERVRRQDR